MNTAVNEINATDFLEVKLPKANCNAFRMVLDYIYTDQIDPAKYITKDEPDQEKIILIRLFSHQIIMKLSHFVGYFY